MRYIFRNIYLLIRNETFLAAAVAVCVITSSWAMLFAFGVSRHFAAAREYGEAAVWELRPEIRRGAAFTVGDFISFMEALPPETGNNIAMFSADLVISGWYDQGGSPSPVISVIRAAVRDNAIVNPEYLLNIWEQRRVLKSGRYFTNEEQAAGAYAALVGVDPSDASRRHPACLQHQTGEDRVELFGKEYEVIGVTDEYNCVTVPAKSLPPDLRLRDLVISFGDAAADDEPLYRLTRHDLDNIKSAAESAAPGVFTFEALEISDPEGGYFYGAAAAAAALTALPAALNIAAAYLFIIRSREKQTAVFAICGASKGKLFSLCLGECLCLTVPLFLLGTAAFVPFMKHVLSGIYPHMPAAFSPSVCAAAAGIWLLTALAVISAALLVTLRGSAVSILKEGAL